jgi:hypothetical protein
MFRYYLSKAKILGIKSPSMWHLDGAKASPVLYFRKAKGASDEDYQKCLQILGFTGEELEK